MAIESIIFYIGLATSIYLSTKIISFAVFYLRPASKSSLVRYRHGSQPYALITGASDGIGFGFAQELARRGFHLILLARNAAKLETAEVKLVHEHLGTKVRTVVLDVLNYSEADLEKAIATIDDLNVNILINNVGGYPSMSRNFKPLTAYSSSEIDPFIDLNARFLPHVTLAVLPILSRNHNSKKRERNPSLILNVSSGAEIGIPWMVMYSVVKGFVSSFSKGLAREMRAEGLAVDVLNMVSGDTQSNSHKIPVAWNQPSSRAMAKAALDRVETTVGSSRLEFKPYWAHGLLLAILQFMPEKLIGIALRDEITKKAKMLDKEE